MLRSILATLTFLVALTALSQPVHARTTDESRIDFMTMNQVLIHLSSCTEATTLSSADDDHLMGSNWTVAACAKLENEARDMGVNEKRITAAKEKGARYARTLRARDCAAARAEGLDDACEG